MKESGLCLRTSRPGLLFLHRRLGQNQIAYFRREAMVPRGSGVRPRRLRFLVMWPRVSQKNRNLNCPPQIPDILLEVHQLTRRKVKRRASSTEISKFYFPKSFSKPLSWRFRLTAKCCGETVSIPHRFAAVKSEVRSLKSLAVICRAITILKVAQKNIRIEKWNEQIWFQKKESNRNGNETWYKRAQQYKQTNASKAK